MGHPGQPTGQLLAPNELWAAGCQGHGDTGDGRSCDPLSVADGDRRFLLDGIPCLRRFVDALLLSQTKVMPCNTKRVSVAGILSRDIYSVNK